MAAVDTLFIYLLSFLPCVSAYTLASEGEEACEMMAVSSDMRREDAQEIMGIFLTQSPEKKDQIATTNTLAVSKRIAERFGGFWDVFILGSRFSYSVYCRQYVQLSTSQIEVLVCKESEKPYDSSGRGIDCSSGFKVTANNTISPSKAPLPEASLFRTGLKDGIPRKTFKEIVKLVERRQFGPNAIANSLRLQLESELGGLWNVIVEEEKSANVVGLYYDYRRQLSLETPGREYVVFMFDRRCRR